MSDEELLTFLAPPVVPERRPQRRTARRAPRPGPVQVSYLPDARCGVCGYLRSKQVPGCEHES